MANISNILGSKKPAFQQRVPFVVQNIHYSQFERSGMQFYDCSKEIVERIADNIEMAGEIEAPIIARKIDAERYEILSGHKRILAVIMLVEERGYSKFALVPTKIVNVDDDMAEYILISTNDYPEKSDYERMMEVVRLYELIPRLEAKKEKGTDTPLTARMLRRLVASETSLCATRVGNFTNIYHHFTESAMEAFKNKEFGINVAIKLASLDASGQDKLVKNGGLTIATITDYIKGKTDTDIKDDSLPQSDYDAPAFDREPTPVNPVARGDDIKTEKSAQNVEKTPCYSKAAEPIAMVDDLCADVTIQPCLDNAEDDDTKGIDLDYEIAMELKKDAEESAAVAATEREKTKARIKAEAISLWISKHYI